MRPASRLAASSLRGRPRRTSLLAVAVALSAALVSAVGCSIATVNATLRQRVDQTVGRADVRIKARTGADFPAAALDAARGWEAAAIVTPIAEAPLPLVNTRTGKRETAVGVGIDPGTEHRLRPPIVREGIPVRARGEVALDKGLAERLEARVGDTLEAQGAGGPHPLRVVAINARPELGLIRRPEAVVTRDTLAEATGAEGRLRQIDVLLREDIDPQSAGEPAGLPPGVVVQLTERITSGLEDNIRASRFGFLVASVFASIAAAFIVFTGLTTSVTERERELAIARCIGASGRQLAFAQLLVGLALGGAGALVGAPLGGALAWALSLVFAERLPAGFAPSALGFALAAMGALVAGLLGAVYPAVRAARTRPLRSLGARARPVSTRALFACALVFAFGAGAQSVMVRFIEQGEVLYFLYIGLALPLMLLGYFVLGPPLVALLSIVAAPLLERLLRLPRPLLRRSMRATPMRAGFTASSLMVGMAIMTSLWAEGGAALRDWLGAMRFPDAFANGWLGLDERAQRRVESLPFVEGTVAITLQPTDPGVFGVERLYSLGSTFIAFEPDEFFRLTSIDFVEGDEASARRRLGEGGAILVSREFKVAKGLGVGDMFDISVKGTSHPFEIVGVVSSPGLDVASRYFGIGQEYYDRSIHSVFGTRADLKRIFGTDAIHLIQIDLSDDVTDEVALKAIREALGGTLLVVGSGREIKEIIGSLVRGSLRILSLVAIGALLVACMGVGNIVAASVEARRREFGVLRAVGADRGLAARLVIGETLIIALGGCILGVALGLQHAGAVRALNRILAGIELEAHYPWGAIALGGMILVALSLAAAAPVAWGVSRARPRELLASTGG